MILGCPQTSLALNVLTSRTNAEVSQSLNCVAGIKSCLAQHFLQLKLKRFLGAPAICYTQTWGLHHLSRSHIYSTSFLIKLRFDTLINLAGKSSLFQLRAITEIRHFLYPPNLQIIHAICSSRLVSDDILFKTLQPGC